MVSRYASMCTPVALLLMVLATCLPTVQTFMFRTKGVVRPSDPYIFIGQDLVLMCNMTQIQPEDSSQLYFMRKADEVIPKEFIRILSTRSIQLRFPIQSPEDEGNYICILNKTSGRQDVIGNQFVEVEYPLKSVETIDCRVHNWQNMTCTWDLGEQYVHPEDLTVSLVWTINGPQFDCPHQTLTSCSWKELDGNNSFKSDMTYTMVVIVENKKLKQSVKSQTQKIETDSLVQPASVSDVTISKNSSCIQLTWKHSSHTIRGKTYRVSYRSEWDNTDHWQERFSGLQESFIICDLVPFTYYDIKIAAKPSGDSGFWSEDMETLVQTEEDVPSRAPALLPGSFSELPCGAHPECRKVILYWRAISPKHRNGVITSYKLTYRVVGEDRPDELDVIGTSNSGTLMLSNSQAYTIELRGATKKGQSSHFSTILLPSKSEIPDQPSDFVVEIVNTTQDDLVTMTWKPPFKEGLTVHSYTVYWCKGSIRTMICRSPMHWETLDNSQSLYVIKGLEKPLDNYIFGISTEALLKSGRVVSSGLTWNNCIYIRNMKPKIAPKNVRFSVYQPNLGLNIEWDPFGCHETRGHVRNFVLSYCKVDTNLNCTGSVWADNINGNEISHVVKNLEADVKYKVWLQAVSDAGRGPASEPIFDYPVDQRLSSEEISGIVVGLTIVLILSLLGAILCARRTYINVKRKYFEQLPIHHVPLPECLPPLPPIPSPPPPKSPDSIISEEGIYERIDDLPSPSSAPPSPGSTSVSIPLINSNTMKQCGFKKSYMPNHRGLRKQSADSGRSSMVSEVDKLLQQLQPTDNRNSNTECNNNFNEDKIVGNRPRLSIPTNNLGQCSSGGNNHGNHYNIQPIYNISTSSEDSYCNSNNNSSNNSGYDSSNSGNINTSSSASPASKAAILENVNGQRCCGNYVSPYSCVDVVNERESTQNGRNDDRIPFQRHLINNTGISQSDDSSSVASFSGLFDLQQSEHSSSPSLSQGNTSENDTRTDSSQSTNNILPNDTASDQPSSAGVVSDISVGADKTSGQAVSSYVRFNFPDILGNTCTPVLKLPDPEKCLPNLNNDGYVDHNRLQTGGIAEQKEVEINKTCLAPPDGSIQPGPRPVSTLVNVPPHFFGSLSLLDDSTAHTTEL